MKVTLSVFLLNNMNNVSTKKFSNLYSLLSSSIMFQFSSVAQLCPTLCDPTNHNTPGLPVHHQLLEFTQTHVHWVSDAIQPSHPVSSPFPSAPNPSQHQGLFQWVNSVLYSRTLFISSIYKSLNLLIPASHSIPLPTSSFSRCPWSYFCFTDRFICVLF